VRVLEKKLYIALMDSGYCVSDYVTAGESVPLIQGRRVEAGTSEGKFVSVEM
jgi:hypothetical protein